MKKLTPEQRIQAQAAGSVNELVELAKANGMEITHSQAESFYANMHPNGLSDAELDNVTGGAPHINAFECENCNGYIQSYPCGHCGYEPEGC